LLRCRCEPITAVLRTCDQHGERGARISAGAHLLAWPLGARVTRSETDLPPRVFPVFAPRVCGRIRGPVDGLHRLPAARCDAEPGQESSTHALGARGQGRGGEGAGADRSRTRWPWPRPFGDMFGRRTPRRSPVRLHASSQSREGVDDRAAPRALRIQAIAPKQARPSILRVRVRGDGLARLIT
jgi:hypothetical protein